MRKKMIVCPPVINSRAYDNSFTHISIILPSPQPVLCSFCYNCGLISKKVIWRQRIVINISALKILRG